VPEASKAQQKLNYCEKPWEKEPSILFFYPLPPKKVSTD